MARIKTLSDLLASEIGIEADDRETSGQAGVAATALLRQNPNRIGLLFINLSVNAMRIRPGRAPTATVGIRIEPSGGWRYFFYREDFTLPARDWFVIADGAASDFYMIELLILSGSKT